MAHVISDECVSCGSCEGECPVGAISEGQAEETLYPGSPPLQCLFFNSNFSYWLI